MVTILKEHTYTNEQLTRLCEIFVDGLISIKITRESEQDKAAVQELFSEEHSSERVKKIKSNPMFGAKPNWYRDITKLVGSKIPDMR